jgi:hypothetical protein
MAEEAVLKEEESTARANNKGCSSSSGVQVRPKWPDLIFFR